MIWATPQKPKRCSVTPSPPAREKRTPCRNNIPKKLADASSVPDGSRETPIRRSPGEGKRLEFFYLSRLQPGEFLFRLTEGDGTDDNDFLQKHLSLTPREAEVLSWIARGKSNRDISEILRISPRTVNKHLEQIFTKLGVENRASAAAQATKILTLR